MIRRAYWIYDVPGGYARGEHAYKQNEEFIVALSGSFDVELDDGNEKRVFSLNRSYNGVLVPKGTWRKMLNFSTNSLALVLASMPFDVNDYVFNYKEFLLWKRGEIAETHSPNTPAQDVPAMLSSAFTIDCKRLVTVFDCSLYQLTREQHPEGSLTFVYEKVHVPFAINRVFYSYDIPSGEDRGAHAHRHCHQLIIAASGSFEVVLDDGVNKRTVMLNRPFWGLHVPPGVWASEQGFSSGSICLVLASHAYEEEDYIRSYDDFIAFRREQTNL